MLARLPLILEHVYQQALMAWEQSCQERQELRCASGRRMRGKDGEPIELPDAQLRTELPPRHHCPLLAQVRGALADIRNSGA